ncbi:hypothetical protein BYT27DRAFT_7340036 [Phlegmacium glaucopus]|nr:hypothetical protein BYT27DRAFT_7340036 [Phlegmacium glaucopus]
MAPGFLAVLSEPGTQVSLDEFHDWYDNEHIPLRLNHLPSFLSGARYQSIDGVKPSWIAVYEIDDTKTFKDQSYTVLREKRSQREADIFGRLEVLDRRTCEVVREVDEGSRKTTGLRVGNPSRWVVTHGINGVNKEEEKDVVEKWLNEVVIKLGKHSWVKTRVLKVLESAKTGVDLDANRLSNEEEQGVPSHFVFHEFVSEESANSSTVREIIEKNSESSLQISEFRRWELYKSYPCVAQGNVEP